MRAAPGRFTRLRRVAGVLAALGLGWAAWLYLFGGFDLRLGLFTLTTNEPLRPLVVGLVALAIFLRLSDVRVWLASIRRILTDGVPTAPLASALTGAVLVVGLTYGSTSLAGSDIYGYFSQADLWVDGDLRIELPWVDEAPWRDADWTFTPLAYRPIGEPGAVVMVPTYSSGLPLLMALAQIVGGYAAMFAVVPITGALVVLVTYGLGRRLGQPGAGLMASLLLATSPAFLMMVVLPMSDVPAAAAWVVAAWWLPSRHRWAPVGAGLAAAMAILIRPNLVFLAAVLGLWFLIEAVRAWPRVGTAIRRGAAFAAAAAVGVAGVAAINHHLFGSPFTSGYGDLDDMFQLAHIGPNVRNYFTWMLASSPVGLLGLAVLAAPLLLWWRTREARQFMVVGAIFVAGIWLHYCWYLVFDHWSYLRFLMPAWPFMMLSAAAVAQALLRHRLLVVRVVTLALVGAIVVVQMRHTMSQYIFRLAESERHYPAAALVVRDRTPDNSVVIAMQHSGTIGYYGGRVVMRYDFLDADELDLAVDWLAERGIPVYALLQDFEVPRFEERFRGQRMAAELEDRCIILYPGTSEIRIYRLTGPVPHPTEFRRVEADVSHLRIVRPSPTPHPALRLPGGP